MDVTHFGHACMLVQTSNARILFDPGTLSSDFEGLHDLDAVLISHQHPDHVDIARLPALLAGNPRTRLISDEATADQLLAVGLPVEVAHPGMRLELGGAVVDIVGGQHAIVHVDIPGCPNNGVVIDGGAFYHPGDSFVVPAQAIDVLALPVSGPWLKVGEAIDFLRAVAPRVAVPVHEAALSSTETHYAMLGGLAPARTTFQPVEHAAPVSV
jgi:L-ascorbate metabolism protein UlaG (beta-lactamase superfamily)